MDITIMGMGTITTINHHQMITYKPVPEIRYWGTKKPCCHITGSMAFLVPYRWAHLSSALLIPFVRRSIPLTRTLRIANIFQIVPFAIEAEDICLT